MADDTWRYAEPDGKQRALSLDDLQRSLAKGLLPTNVPVWRAGFADWTPASDVPELRASVSSGARIIPPKGTQRPGRPVAQRGGAAATGEEPMSPPSYSPARKARPTAPALDLGKSQSDKPLPAAGAADPGQMRSRASTLLIAGGAPALDRNPESEGVPINVPTPGGANEAPNTITRPPPVSDTAAVVPAIPPSSGKINAATVSAAAAGAELDDQAETREMPAAQRATLRDEAWDIPEEPSTSSGPVHDVSSSMLLPDSAPSGSVPEVVSTSMLLPNDDSSGMLPATTSTTEVAPVSERSPDSTEEIPDSEVISAREPEVKRPTMPPPLRSSRPSHPAVNPSLRPSRPSFPSRSEVLNQTPAPSGTQDVAERIGLKSKPPPPDINPLSSDFPPPPGVPAEARDDDKTDPSIRKRREAERRAKAPEAKPVVPLWGAIAAVVVVGGGVWMLKDSTGSGDGPSEDRPAASASSAAVVAPIASAAAADAGSKDAIACRLTSSARPIVEDVLQPAGLEVAMSNARIAVGFAKGPREAAAVELDPASLAPKNTVTSKAPGDITRVVPRFDQDQLVALPESANMTKGVGVQRRAGEVALGISKSKLVRIADEGPPEELFTLPAANVDALRIFQLPTSKTDAAYTYRAPGSVWLGTTQKNDSPQRIPGLGPQVGSPSVVALDAKSLIAVWADRADENDKWALRIAAYSPGKGNVTPKTFAPKDRPGAMLSPALVRIDASHALLLWTLEHEKGDARSYEVLAQTLDAKGTPLGEAFSVSAADMSGGQPQGVMGEHGKGTIAFLVSHGDAYDLAVAGVDCGGK